jgi:ABC-2 type transport system permease protein
MTLPELQVAFTTIVVREVRRFMRIWIQTLVPSVITAALYFLIFGELIGSRIGPIAGINYAEFVAPGLVMLSAITNAYGNTVSSFFGSKFQNHIEEVLVSPTPPLIVLLGFLIGGIARGLIVAFLVWLLSAVFVGFQLHDPIVAIAVLVLTTTLFSLLGLLNGMYANTFDDITIVPTFVLVPLIYLGGVFYSTSMLPPLWANASMFNPILYMVDTLRYGLIGVAEISLSMSFLSISTLIVIFFYLNLHMLTHSKRLRN